MNILTKKNVKKIGKNTHIQVINLFLACFFSKMCELPKKNGRKRFEKEKLKCRKYLRNFFN
jgi:hypothetical protein